MPFMNRGCQRESEMHDCVLRSGKPRVELAGVYRKIQVALSLGGNYNLSVNKMLYISKKWRTLGRHLVRSGF